MGGWEDTTIYILGTYEMMRYVVQPLWLYTVGALVFCRKLLLNDLNIGNINDLNIERISFYKACDQL
jgi:hypothetical protein